MQTSFQKWLEAKDPDLYVLMEAEWNRRNRKPWLGLAGAGLLGLGALGAGISNRGEEPSVASPAPRAAQPPIVKTIEADEGRPSKYSGGDAKQIFNYACNRSHDHEEIFPYYNEDGQQEGLIARTSMAVTSTSPLSKTDLDGRYYSFVKRIRATMKGKEAHLHKNSYVGTSKVNWEYIAIGKANPFVPGSFEIVLYAKQAVGE